MYMIIIVDCIFSLFLARRNQDAGKNLIIFINVFFLRYNQYNYFYNLSNNFILLSSSFP